MKSFILRYLPRWTLDGYHYALALCAALLYGFPSRKLVVIGVTGTNGKTTVVQLISHILETAGCAVGHLSSVDFKIGPMRIVNDLKMTMPGRFFVQKMLRRMADGGCGYVVVEVTSEGILQHRHRFIDFDVAVLTNVTPEHLERHGGFERYRNAKGKLFAALKVKSQKSKAGKSETFQREPRAGGERAMVKTANQNSKLPKGKRISIINLDDPSAPYFLKFDTDEKWGFSMNAKVKSQKLESPRLSSGSPEPEASGRWSKLQIKTENCIVAEDVSISDDRVAFVVNGVLFRLSLMGEFNVANALAAIAACRSQGVSPEVIKRACASFPGVPGRMELVVEKPFTVIVDYGHTPDALEKVYASIQENYKLKANSHKLVCVFGSTGGGRDKWKRPEMGKVAAKFCDAIVLTDDDPYDENSEAILGEIEQGILSSVNYMKIVDRRQAITAAIQLARPGDAVIITGKGAEPWLMGPKGAKIPWDDREIAREAARRQV